MELTRSEFETLPPTLRRKYLSPSERQKYSQAYGVQPDPPRRGPAARRKPAAPRSRHQSYFARDILYPKQHQQRQQQQLLRAKPVPHRHEHTSPHHLSRSRQQQRPQQQRPQPQQQQRHHHRPRPKTGANVSNEDALFFSRLPEKLQRRQFSAAERQLFAGQEQQPQEERRTVPHTAQDRLYALGGRNANRSLPSLSSTCSGRSSPRSFTTDDLQTLWTTEDAEDELMSNFHWVNDSNPDLALDDYHMHLTTVAKTLPEPKLYQPLPRAPARRNRSFTNFSLSFIPRTSIDKNMPTEMHKTHASLDSKIGRIPPGVISQTRTVAVTATTPAKPQMPVSRYSVAAAQPIPQGRFSVAAVPPHSRYSTVAPQSQAATHFAVVSVGQPPEKRPAKPEKQGSKPERRGSKLEKRPSLTKNRDSTQLERSARPAQPQWRGSGWQPPEEWWGPLPRKPSTSHMPLTYTAPQQPQPSPRRVSTSSTMQAAEHYMDPDARRKLRTSLASPAKFDEAIRYGFPAVRRSTSPALSPPVSARNSMPARPVRTTSLSVRAEFGGTENREPATVPSERSGRSSARHSRGPHHTQSLTFLRDETTSPEMSVERNKEVRRPASSRVRPSPLDLYNKSVDSEEDATVRRTENESATEHEREDQPPPPPPKNRVREYQQQVQAQQQIQLQQLRSGQQQPQSQPQQQPYAAPEDDVDEDMASSPSLTATSPGLTETSFNSEHEPADEVLESARERIESIGNAGAAAAAPRPMALPTSIQREMTLRMTLTRPDLRGADDPSSPYSPAAHLVAPQMRFATHGSPRGAPAPGAPMDPLSMEQLFCDEPVVVKTRGPLRRLFSRR